MIYNFKTIRSLTIFINLTLFSFIFSGIANGYEVNVHEALTNETIKFYNQQFPHQQISSSLYSYLIDGSRREDDPPRWMNHFYDPVHDIGLKSVQYGDGQKSKDWAKDEDRQITERYNPIIGTILASFQQGKLERFLPTSNFTWQEAIRYYVNGDEEMAMFTLGHVLHLLEDVSVPDHTRNDPHPAFDDGDTLETGSPYEIWTRQFNQLNLNLSNKLLNKKAISLPIIEEYFDQFATYSNKNFYSKDTIGIQSGYLNPQPDYEKKEGNLLYGMKIDREFGDYMLYEKTVPDILFVKKSSITLKPVVLEDYWDRLSVKSVQYGAGLIDLFFKEVEKAKNDPNFVRTGKQSLFARAVSGIKNTTGRVVDLVSNVVSVLTGNTSIQVTQFNNTESEEEAKEEDDSFSDSEEADEEGEEENPLERRGNPFLPKISEAISAVTRLIVKSDPPKPTRIKASVSSAPKKEELKQPAFCRFEEGDGEIPTRLPVIINELAWMGTEKSANDEWIELKNISGNTHSLNGWQLIGEKNDVQIMFDADTKTTKASPLFLLERTDNNSAPAVDADIIYQGALSQKNDGLRLFDNNCVLIDEVLARSEWPAGNAVQRRTMERGANFSWHTHQGVGLGTPRAENSNFTPPFSSGGSGGGGSSGGSSKQASNNAEISNTIACVRDGAVSASQKSVRINEVQWMGTLKSSSDEWIELMNETSAQISLKGWHLRDKDNEIAITFEAEDVIGSSGFYVLERTDEGTLPSIAAEKIYTGGLENSNEALYLYNSSCELVDEVNASSEWPGGSKDERRSMERKNNSEWGTYGGATSSEIFGTPGKENSGGVSGALLATSTAGHILISELYPDQTGSNKDFVELYNPTNQNISLDNMWLWVSGPGNDEGIETESPVKKIQLNSGSGIASRGYFLIGLDDYTSSTVPIPDLLSGTGFLHTQSGGRVSIMHGEVVIDEVHYSKKEESGSVLMPKRGASIERKTLENGQCVSPLNERQERSCDTDSSSDFIIREVPGPRNSLMMFENDELSVVALSSTLLGFDLNWDSFARNSGGGDVRYEVSYVSQINGNTSSSTLIQITTSTTAIVSLKEVGSEYIFTVKARNASGTEISSITGEPVLVKSFINNLFVYPVPSATTTYFFDLRYASSQFIPDVYGNGSPEDKYKILVFYKNKPASTKNILTSLDDFVPSTESIPIFYKDCSGISSNKAWVLLPGIELNCRPGGLYGKVMDFYDVLPTRLNLLVNGASFIEGDYVTVGYYSRRASSPSGVAEFELVAVDTTKYYFGTSTPVSAKPTDPLGISASVNEEGTRADISWRESEDNDSLKSSIRYEMNVVSSTVSSTLVLENNGWREVSTMIFGNDPLQLRHEFVDTVIKTYYKVGVRAHDEVLNYSNSAIVEFFVNGPPEPLINQSNRDAMASFAFKGETCATSSYVAQSVTFGKKVTLSTFKTLLQKTSVKNMDNAALRIESNASGLPSGEILKEVVKMREEIETIPLVYSFDLDGMKLDPGTYWFTIQSKNNSNTLFDEGYEVGWLTGDPYPDGKFYLWNCGNPWLERPGDMYMVLDGLEE